MEWIHCNLCFRQPRSKDPNFVLSSCGHIFCKNCESREKADNCQSCNAPCLFVNLSASMKPEVKVYFDDLESKLKSIYECFRFQKSHRLNLYKKHARMAEEFYSLRRENAALKKSLKKLTSKLESLERKQTSLGVQSTTPNQFNFTPAQINREISVTPDSAFRRLPNSVSYPNHPEGYQKFAVPNLESYKQYRGIQYPGSTGSTSSTPDRFARQFSDRMRFASHPSSSRIPLKTPPYDDMNRLRIRKL